MTGEGLMLLQKNVDNFLSFPFFFNLMIKSNMFKIVRGLELDEKKTVYKQGNVTIQLYRPSKLSPRFRNYNPKKNFFWLLTTYSMEQTLKKS